MFHLLILIVTFIVSEVSTDFYAGRISPGKFEYPKYNGWMLVEEAKAKCQNDLACGGFTFKGSYKTLTLSSSTTSRMPIFSARSALTKIVARAIMPR